MHQKCGNCGTKFKYKSILKSFWLREWSGEKIIKCEDCETEHEISNYVILFLLFALPLFFILIPYKRLIMIVLYIISFFLLMPLLFKFKMTKKD